MENNEINNQNQKNEFTTLDITKLTPLSRVLAMVKNPQRPGNACKMSSGFLHENEISKIAAHLKINEDQLKDKLLEKKNIYNKDVHRPKLLKYKNKEHLPFGKCIFLESSKDGHKCQLEDNMPLHCRLSTSESYGHKIHNWYVLNYIVDPNDSNSIREWASYLKHQPTIPGGELRELVPNNEELKKIIEYEFEKQN